VGWSVLYNEKSKYSFENFSKRRHDFGWNCNGCQLMMELELINPEHEVHGK
jgi:phosphoribosylformylglycinamidine synthase